MELLVVLPHLTLFLVVELLLQVFDLHFQLPVSIFQPAYLALVVVRLDSLAQFHHIFQLFEVELQFCKRNDGQKLRFLFFSAVEGLVRLLQRVYFILEVLLLSTDREFQLLYLDVFLLVASLQVEGLR